MRAQDRSAWQSDPVQRRAKLVRLKMHGSGAFEDDVGDDISRVAAAVNYFFEQFVEVF